DQLLRRLRPDDLARVGVFGLDITISPANFTRDMAELRAAIPTEMSRNAPTPLWEAMDKAMDQFGESSGRRVVLLLTDGKDTGPSKLGGRYYTVLDVIDRAQREETMVYGIGLHSRLPPGAMSSGGAMMANLGEDLPDPGLGKLAIETGGGYF